MKDLVSTIAIRPQRFGASHISQVLRGASTERVRNFDHDRLTVFGIAKDSTDDELKQMVSLLLARELLVKSESQYLSFAVTQAGHTFLRHRENLTLMRPKRSPEVVSARDETDTEYDRRLFEKLRTLRKRIADERDVPAFIIFGDVSLREMAYSFPQSRESFARINGVGAEKLEQFSDEFLAVICQHARENGLTERSIPQRRMKRDGTAKRLGGTYEETKKMVMQKLPISEIAERRGLTEGTIMSHLAQLTTAGEELDIDYLMPPASRLSKIRAAFEKVGSLTSVTPVRDLLGEEYSYDELRLVRIYLQQTGRATGVREG